MALSSKAQRRLITLVPPLLVGLLVVPFALRQNAWWEWTSALWLLERQSEYVSAHGVPTLFLHIKDGGFYPFYAFYAGFTISVLAYPAAVLGTWPVFVASLALALMAGYVGIWWTARSLGLPRGLAILPALTFSLTPYLVSDVYGRGAWAELLAVNAAALALGAVTALLRYPERKAAGPLVVLVGATAVVAGTHNITLLTSALLMPLVVAAVAPLVLGGCRGRTLWMSLLRVAAGILLGVGLTGAWLLPNLWLGGDTAIARSSASLLAFKAGAPFSHLPTLLSPWPSIPAGARTPAGTPLHAQPPVLAMIWALLVLPLVLRRRRPSALRMTAAALVALGAGLLVLIASPGWWRHFPETIQTVQFAFRLLPYLAMVVALAVAVTLVALPAGRAWRIAIPALVVVVVVQAGMTVAMALNTRAAPRGPTYPALIRHGQVLAESEPPAFATPGNAPLAQFRVLKRPTGPKTTDPAAVELGRVTTSNTARLLGLGQVGQPLTTPIVWSRLIRVSGGARAAGRNANGALVVRVTHTDATGSWKATVRPQCTMLCLGALSGDAPWQLMAGRLVTLLSAVGLVVVLIAGWRRRRRSGPVVVDDQALTGGAERAPATIR